MHKAQERTLWWPLLLKHPGWWSREELVLKEIFPPVLVVPRSSAGFALLDPASRFVKAQPGHSAVKQQVVKNHQGQEGSRVKDVHFTISYFLYQYRKKQFRPGAPLFSLTQVGTIHTHVPSYSLKSINSSEPTGSEYMNTPPLYLCPHISTSYKWSL